MKRDTKITDAELSRYLGRYGSPSEELIESEIDRAWKELEMNRRWSPPNPENTESRRPSRRFWSFRQETIAIALVVAAVFTAWLGRSARTTHDAQGFVESVDDVLYRGASLGPMHSGESFSFGEPIRTARAGAVFVLADHSRVEMRSDTELLLEKASDGVRIRLQRGSVIVSASKQRNGHLYVQTKDLSVSVVGTVFMVNATEMFSRVAVIEGEVHVHQGASDKALLPGEQISTNPSAETRAVSQEIAWSRQAPMHAALLQQPRLAFEVSSIKPMRSDDPRRQASRFYAGGRFTATLPLKSLIALAYRSRIEPAQLSGGSGWIESERFDIDARAPEGVIAPGPLSRDGWEKMERMVQTLLADRFKVQLRSEFREGTVYRLTVAEDGPKLKPAEKVKDCNASTEDASTLCHAFVWGPASAVGQSIDMNDLVMFLRKILGQPVLDDTDVSGLHDISLHWTPDSFRSANGPENTRAANGESPIDPDGPDLPTALREQLGLRLESQKGPVEYITIEHFERPTEN